MLQGDLVDLEPLLRDAVVLALPFQPLCMDDCPGLCPECGARLADDPDHAHDAAIDPRWAALADLSGQTDQRDRPQTDRRTEERTPWLSRSGRCRAATRATVARPWKATAPTLVTCANPACGAKHLPHRACGNVRPVRRAQRPSPGPLMPGADVPTATTAQLRAALGDPVLDPELLERALTHRSYAYENGGLPTNERLEFLGDSVLGVVVTETLYLTHPDLSEGRLAKLRAAVVNARALAEVGRGIGLGEHIKLGRGEETTGGRDKASILSDTVEAVIGAVHLSGGIEVSAERRAPALRPADRGGLGARRRPGLEDLAPGARRRARPRCPRVRHRRTRAPTTRRPSPPRSGSPTSSTATASAAPRRRPSRRPPRRRTARSPHARHRRPDRRGGAPTTRRRRRRRRRRLPRRDLAAEPMPELPEVEVVRAGLDAPRRRRHHHLGRGAPPASGPPRPARPGAASRPR